MKKTLLASALLLAANSALAGNFGYTYVEGGFGEHDDGDGFFLGGAADIQQGFGVIGSYYALELDDDDRWYDEDVTADIFTVGVQFHTPLNSQADFVGSVQLINAETKSLVVSLSMATSAQPGPMSLHRSRDSDQERAVRSKA